MINKFGTTMIITNVWFQCNNLHNIFFRKCVIYVLLLGYMLDKLRLFEVLLIKFLGNVKGWRRHEHWSTRTQTQNCFYLISNLIERNFCVCETLYHRLLWNSSTIILAFDPSIARAFPPYTICSTDWGCWHLVIRVILPVVSCNM